MDRITTGGMSIGTGIALESVFELKNRYDDEREIPNKVDIEDYEYHIFSIHTLIRNILNSFPKESKMTLENKDFKNYIIEDIHNIAMYYEDSECVPLILNIDYDKYYKKFNMNKEVKTTNALIGFLEINHFVKKLKLDKIKNLPITVINDKQSGIKNKKLLFTTSYLLDFHIYGNHDLLESHTGKLLNRNKLSSKYHKIGSKDLSHLPYTETLHYLLGDRTFVAPMNLVTRRKVYDLCENFNVRTKDMEVRKILSKDEDLKDILSKWR